jgi:hypothetical protein
VKQSAIYGHRHRDNRVDAQGYLRCADQNVSMAYPAGAGEETLIKRVASNANAVRRLSSAAGSGLQGRETAASKAGGHDSGIDPFLDVGSPRAGWPQAGLCGRRNTLMGKSWESPRLQRARKALSLVRGYYQADVYLSPRFCDGYGAKAFRAKHLARNCVRAWMRMTRNSHVLGPAYATCGAVGLAKTTEAR